MGLDQYAKVRNPKTQQVEEFHYWRKHNALHGWMENLWKSKGNTGEFNCEPVELSRADIDMLEDDLLGNDLPETKGFFFGSDSRQDDSRLMNDLSFIRKAKQHLNAGKQIAYDSWW
jgi:hypothetical protein